MSQDAKLLTIARSWLGTPFQHQGRLKGVGVDCIGLVIEVYREAGLLTRLGFPEGWNYTGYGRQANKNTVQDFLARYLVRALPPYPAGSVGVFPLGHALPSHTALLFQDGHALSMLHAYNSPGTRRFRVQEHAVRGLWRQRLWAAYAPPGEA